MSETLLPLAQDWIPKLVKAGAAIWRDREKEIGKIFNEFGDSELLATSYIEPDCQPTNPADHREDEPRTTWMPRTSMRQRINEFLKAEFLERDGRNTLFVLSDAGMGKSSLLMMLKLSHLVSFWPAALDFRLMKLGETTLDEIGALEDRRHTVVLLDALDEDPRAWGRIEERLAELLHATANFRQVILTCRTQFFPKGGRVPMQQDGKVELAGFVCNLLYLSPFSDEQVDQYLRKVYPDSLIGRVRKLLTQEDNRQLQRARRLVLPMNSLRMRPMLLAYIQDLMEPEITDWSEFPVYEALVHKWLLREERKPGQQVTREKLWEACQLLALHLQTAGKTALAHDDLDDILKWHPALESLTTFEFGGRSLLNRNADGDYRFAHYSIQEFLVVYALVAGDESWSPEPIHITDQILLFSLSWLDGTDAGAASSKAEVLTRGLEPETREKIFEGDWENLPKFDHPLRAIGLIDVLRRRTRNGQELFFLDQAVVKLIERWPDLQAFASKLRERLYEHIPPPPEDLFQWITTPRDGRVALWREIPAGSFLMGSPPGEGDDDEHPQHQVTVTSRFRLAAVPVTEAQYAAFDPKHASKKRANIPVADVNWYEAVAFCRWLSIALPHTVGARLPSEEEWEYACRAGTESRYWSGDSKEDLEQVGWYNENSGRRVHRVGEKPANPWGLYDMHGNIWEWTLTEWKDSYSGRESGITVDPAVEPADLAVAGSGRRVARGGSCWSGADGTRSAYRDRRDPEAGIRIRGFRVVLPLSAAPSS